MVETTSQMLPIGTTAPDFTLPDTEGREVSLSQFEGAPAYLVMFICNHCPFVIHVKRELAELCREYQERGVAVVAINANDANKYPDDSPERMKADKEALGYTFPYLYDETQEIAKAYRAACTPDFYVFDKSRKLVYRGQMDDSRPGSDTPVTGRDLRKALDAALANESAPDQQKPSMGCNIKWKPGNAPEYFSS
ncbi:MAG: redoxin domain-containing protein [Candidatus Eisenbacteria bacterium]|nr:redoxin domain-containing protein [Candidatus Eisenbacteria bacterium]